LLALSYFQKFFSFSLFLLASLIFLHTNNGLRASLPVDEADKCQVKVYLWSFAIERKTNSLPARTGKVVAGRDVYVYPFMENEMGSSEQNVDRPTNFTFCSQRKYRKKLQDENKEG